MQRFKARLIAAAALAVVAAPLAMSSPAGAIPAGNGCNASGVPAALISWYPANPGSMSALHTACSWNNQPGTSQVSASFTVHDADVANYHNGAAKGVTNSVAAVAGATTIQLNPAANGIVGLPVAPTQMNRMITGPGIAIRTHIKSMTAGGLATLSRPTSGAVPINSALKIENATARIVDDATSTLPDLLNSTQANFTAADIGLSVSGTGVANDSSILAINSATQVQLDNPIGNPLGGPVVSIGGSLLTANAKVITQASITSLVRINSSAAGWIASDVGLKVTGTCHQNTAAAGDDTTIPAATVITVVVSGANVDTTGGLPNGSTGCNLVIGEPNANAPANGDVAAQQGVQLNLNPGLVAGSADCGDDQPEGFGIISKWYNPGSFQGIGATNAVPGSAVGATTLPTKAIGQLFFDTSAADFSAFIVQRKVLTAGDPIGTAHFDVVFPFAPTSLAMCPGTATSPGLTSSLYINSTTQSQSTLASGTGRPGTGQVRNIVPSTTGGYTTTAVVDSQGAATFSPASAFNRLCIYPAGFPNAANFQCGPG
jgi:hypothetical protein